MWFQAPSQSAAESAAWEAVHQIAPYQRWVEIRPIQLNQGACCTYFMLTPDIPAKITWN